MSNKKNGERKKEAVAFYLLPASEEPRIYRLQLNDEVLGALRGSPDAASIRLGTGKSDNYLKVGGSEWQLQMKGDTQKAGQLDCISTKDGYYMTMGKISQRFTVPAPKTLNISKYKSKSDAIESMRSNNRADIKHDSETKGIHRPGKRPRPSEIIGENKAKNKTPKERADKMAERMSEDELKSRIIHWLALRDMDKQELKRKCEVSEFPKGLCARVATWDQHAQLYRLLPSAVRDLDVESCKLYSDDERRVVRARVKLVSPSAVSITSEEDALQWRGKYKEKHEEYKRLDQKLRDRQEEFERLGKQLASSDSTKQESRTKKDIQSKFSQIKTELMVDHTDFMRLHDELTNIKDGLHQFKHNKSNNR